MEPYLFRGVVLPEQAKLSLGFSLDFTHPPSGAVGRAKVEIIENQIGVSLHSDHTWNLYDLRNVVKNIVQSHLAMVSYLTGFAYEFSITGVVCPPRGIDYVFGIDIPCIVDLRKSVDVLESLRKIKARYTGPGGLLLNRCFADLVSAMNNADDTAFYCYRAIESLRLHCGVVHGLPDTDKPSQWIKFREVAGCDEATVRAIEEAAKPLRHGGVTWASDRERVALFLSTWAIVDGYLKCV